MILLPLLAAAVSVPALLHQCPTGEVNMTYNGRTFSQYQGPAACPANATCCVSLFANSNGCKYPGSDECSVGAQGPISEALPNCLVIGDSVSNQYTPHVAALLNTTCMVLHAPWVGGGSANNAANGLRHLQAGHWLRTTERPDRAVAWDLIMFNFGLHDLPKTTPPLLDLYQNQMDNITKILLRSGAKRVLYALTTPFQADQHKFCGPYCANHTLATAEEVYTAQYTSIPQPKADGNGRCGPPACTKGAPGCGTPVVGREKLGCGPPTMAVTKLNGRAALVMKKHGVPTLDLNALVHSHCGASYSSCKLCDNESKYMGIQCGYHYSSVGIPILANAVAKAMRAELQKPPLPRLLVKRAKAEVL
jgi:hypothetical protein